MQSHLPSHSFVWTLGGKDVYLGEGMGPHWALGRTEDFFLFSKLGLKLCANPGEHKRALVKSCKSSIAPGNAKYYFLQNESSDYPLF